MKITLLGRCQFHQLKSLLAAENRNDEFLVIENYTKLSDEEIFEHICGSDYVVARVYGSGTSRKLMRPENLRALAGSKLVTVGAAVNHALFPDFSYVGDLDFGGCPYIPIAALDAYAHRASVCEATRSFDSMERYDERAYFDLRASTASHLRRLDGASDIKIAPIIEDLFDREHSFHSFNHPAMNVIEAIAKQIYEKINHTRKISIDTKFIFDPSMKLPVLPVSNAVAERFDLKFKPNRLFKSSDTAGAPGRWISIEDMMARAFAHFHSRERHNLSRLGLDEQSISPRERRMLLEVGNLRSVPLREARKYRRRDAVPHGVSRTGDNAYRLRFTNTTDAPMRFDANCPLRIRAQLWDGARCIVHDYFSYDTGVATLAEHESFESPITIPDGAIRKDRDGLHFRFGVVHEGVRWLLDQVPMVFDTEHGDLAAARSDGHPTIPGRDHQPHHAAPQMLPASPRSEVPPEG